MHRPPRFLVVAALLLLPLVGAACGGGDDDDTASPSASAAPGAVDVIDNKFEPETIEISAGDTVTWEFKGAVVHNVSGEGFKSKTVKSGTFSHTFESAGTFDYVCTIHPGMKGTVEVG